MENRNKLNEITKKLSEISLNISRVPSNTKRDFISLANAEFCGDYGMLLKTLVDEFIAYQNVKALFFDKLQNMEDKIDRLSDNLSEQESSKEVRKTLSGRQIK